MRVLGHRKINFCRSTFQAVRASATGWVNAPLTVRGVKEMGRRLLARRRLTRADTRDLMEMCYASTDFREGVAAFLAKRQPRWTGR